MKRNDFQSCLAKWEKGRCSYLEDVLGVKHRDEALGCGGDDDDGRAGDALRAARLPGALTAGFRVWA